MTGLELYVVYVVLGFVFYGVLFSSPEFKLKYQLHVELMFEEQKEILSRGAVEVACRLGLYLGAIALSCTLWVFALLYARLALAYKV